jgi:hypothetical protein
MMDMLGGMQRSVKIKRFLPVIQVREKAATTYPVILFSGCHSQSLSMHTFTLSRNTRAHCLEFVGRIPKIICK